MFFVSLFSLIRSALMIIVVQSLGIGLDASRGRVISVAYIAQKKGLLNVKENICGCSPPGRNTRSCG